ncbi:hypothetical protein VTL71DRAFT_5468 [Oculimacula yallundae]|uniref:Myb-like domain-containing protein n=1 Tax=Oculimacula yallundae TaxID=86028 RepID=A0ABR4C159_9HELO
MKEIKQQSGQNDAAYPTNYLGRTQAEDFAPYSARSDLSSFNLTPQYDADLVTPVSMTSSPHSTKLIPSMITDPYIKTSPGPLSPPYGNYSPDSDFYQRYNPPMKHKDSSTALHISTTDHSFPPGSPYTCPSPYYGNFGVSAQPQSVKVESSPMFLNSPTMQSVGSYRNNGFYSRNQTPALSTSNYKSNSQTPIQVAPRPYSPPILIAPHPSVLKPATAKSGSGARRQSSKPSNIMSRPLHKASQQKYSPVHHSSGSEVQKCNTKKRRNATPGMYEKLMAAAQIREISPEERMLLQLRYRDGFGWSEIEERYALAFPGGKPKLAAALQMKKMRLVERLQDWTDVEVRKKRALVLSEAANTGKWKTIAKRMPEYGAKNKWSAEGCKKQFEDMQSKDTMSQYEFQAENFRRHSTLSAELTQQSPGQQSWSDDAGSVILSPFSELPSHFVANMSATNMEDTRSRTASDASVEMQIQQQNIRQMQQQIVYQQQNQQSQQQRQYNQSQQSRHNSWASGP